MRKNVRKQIRLTEELLEYIVIFQIKLNKSSHIQLDIFSHYSILIKNTPSVRRGIIQTKISVVAIRT